MGRNGMVAATLALLAAGVPAAPPPVAAARVEAPRPAALTGTVPVGTPVRAGVPGPGAVPARMAPARAWRWPLEGEPRVLVTFERPAHRWSPGHRGVDLAADAGQQVVAPAGGTVTFVGRVVDRSVVAVDAPEGLRATVEPVAATVAVGDVVAAGDALGTVEDPTVGRGHCAPAVCLHWGVRRSGGRDALYLDPLLVVLAQGSPGALVLLPRGGV